MIVNQKNVNKVLEELEKYFAKNLDRVNFRNSNQVYNYLLPKLADKKEEIFYILYLNAKNRLIDEEIASIGIENQAIVYPKKIVKRALELNAVSVIIAHNHPTGDIEYSNNDIQITQSIFFACKFLDIELLEHIIVGSGKYYSFADSGDINLIKKRYGSIK